MRKKPKLKTKGQRIYRNTQGRYYRLIASYKIRSVIQHKKRLKRMEPQGLAQIPREPLKIKTDTTLPARTKLKNADHTQL